VVGQPARSLEVQLLRRFASHRAGRETFVTRNALKRRYGFSPPMRSKVVTCYIGVTNSPGLPGHRARKVSATSGLPDGQWQQPFDVVGNQANCRGLELQAPHARWISQWHDDYIAVSGLQTTR